MNEFGMKIKTTVLRALVLAGVSLGLAAGAGATPVTFAFEAVVDQVSGNADGLVEVVIGDIVHGNFTYEPTPFGVRSEQMHELSFDVNELLLVSDAYQITLENDAAVPFTGTPTFPGILDSAHIACSSSGNECTPENISSQNGWKWNPFIAFSGNFGILANEELTSNLNWNGFGNRNLQLKVENQSA